MILHKQNLVFESKNNNNYCLNYLSFLINYPFKIVIKYYAIVSAFIKTQKSYYYVLNKFSLD